MAAALVSVVGLGLRELEAPACVAHLGVSGGLECGLGLLIELVVVLGGWLGCGG